MSIAHPGDDEEADLDQTEPLLRDPDTYSLNSLDESDGDDVSPASVVVKGKHRRYVQHKIHALFPDIQSIPRKWFEKHAPTTRRKTAILMFTLGHWVALMIFICVRSSSIPAIAGYGEPRRLTCYSNAFVGQD
jgi:hypothetical protein